LDVTISRIVTWRSTFFSCWVFSSFAALEFGKYVSISGDYTIVGAPYNDSNGSAYIFKRDEKGEDNLSCLPATTLYRHLCLTLSAILVEAKLNVQFCYSFAIPLSDMGCYKTVQ